ncbi:protein takeout [Drosophila sulfurigaster albostrigata]|uniref:protein takeout n=1 Tax=Drosophila sulfurigaster albostrigata TaxID=89887 RepID=UPI002D218C97|nr:protein takeout [Drosophila sulfurigaster albostrigata]
MNVQCIVVILCLLAYQAYAMPAETKYLNASEFEKCPEDANAAGDCIAKIINTLLPRLRLGDPELNIPAYDPFLIDKLSFQYSSGAVNGRISVRNVKLYGIVGIKIQKIDVKRDNNKIQLRIYTHQPNINILGDYKADMHVNQLQLKPKGKFNLTLFDVQTTVNTEGEIYTKDDGKRFLRLIDIEANPKIGDMIIKANGIFPDPELDEIALNVANNYWRDIYGIILPETRKSWVPLLLRLINQALLKVPIDEFTSRSN